MLTEKLPQTQNLHDICFIDYLLLLQLFTSPPGSCFYLPFLFLSFSLLLCDNIYISMQSCTGIIVCVPHLYTIIQNMLNN